MLILRIFTFLVLLPSLLNYQPIKEYDFDSVIIEYGNYLNADNQDGYFRIYDKTSKSLIKEVIYDNRGYDIFRYLAYLNDDIFVIVCDTYITSDSFALPTYKETVLLKYNIEGVLIDRLYLERKPVSFHNHNFNLVIKYKEEYIIYDRSLSEIALFDIEESHVGQFNYQYQGEAYVNGIFVENIDINYPGFYSIKISDNDYEFEFSITIEADCKIFGEKYLDGYLGEVRIYSFGQLFLNNKEYNSGEIITTVGNYLLLIEGKSNYSKLIEFTILPDVAYYDGIEYYQLLENSEFQNSIRIYSNGISMFLNDNFYNSELIDMPGRYNLDIYGINDFMVTISFLILPNVSGVDNNKTYEEVGFIVFGEAILNGKSIKGQNYIDESGEYELILLLDNEPFETIYFTVDNTIEIENSFTLEPYIKYIFLLISIIGGALFLRKK